MNTRLKALGAAAAALWLADPGHAYWFNGNRWPSQSSIVMHLQMGSPGGALLDGVTSWNVVAEGALGTWNSSAGLTFRVVRDSTDGIALRNGINNVFWDDDVYGDSFGDSIAVTRWLYRVSDNTTVEADVIFDTARSWNSYRGNLRSASGGGTLYDLRRVALHEFGHVLGLGHPDDHGQSVTAIMNSRISNTESLQTDDINGARAIYGGSSPTSNRAPVVTASCSPCAVTTGQMSALRATASDPDGDSLSYRWSSSQGTFSDPTAPSTTWTAPDDATIATVIITVQDSRGGSATASVSIQVTRTDRLQPGARLLGGQSLWSSGGRYRLVYQSDGNLVLYDEVARTAPWGSGTPGTSPGQVAMQPDGNLVIYDAQGIARFATGTDGNANAYLLVQNDGNVVLYTASGQPLWDRFR